MADHPDADRSLTSAKTQKAIADFDRSALLVRRFLGERYGDRGADDLIGGARARYAELLPKVRWVKGRRAGALNLFLAISAQEIAVFEAVRDRGGDESEAWEICHRALRTRIDRIPKWKHWLMRRFLFSALVRQVIRRRAHKGIEVRAGDFAIRSVLGDGESFDFGVDYVQCGNLELARAVGAESFAPYLCMSDIALSEGLGWGLVRTQTLADGCSHCDFRFKKDGETRISSCTPEVQGVVQRIARREAADRCPPLPASSNSLS